MVDSAFAVVVEVADVVVVVVAATVVVVDDDIEEGVAVVVDVVEEGVVVVAVVSSSWYMAHWQEKTLMETRRGRKASQLEEGSLDCMCNRLAKTGSVGHTLVLSFLEDTG